MLNVLAAAFTPVGMSLVWSLLPEDMIVLTSQGVGKKDADPG